MTSAAPALATAGPHAATPGGAAAGHFVFISYSAHDKEVADTICRMVEAAGVRCWIAPRDVQPGREWRPSIIEAIERCNVMVLVFSDDANRSSQVSREVEVAFDEGKTIIPFRIENTEMNKSLRYCISATHWLDALTPPLSEHADRLIATLAHLVADASAAAPGSPVAGALADATLAVAPPAPAPVPAADAPQPADRLHAAPARRAAEADQPLAPLVSTPQAAPVPAEAPARVPGAGVVRRDTVRRSRPPARTSLPRRRVGRAAIAAIAAGMVALPAAAVWAVGGRGWKEPPVVDVPIPSAPAAVAMDPVVEEAPAAVPGPRTDRGAPAPAAPGYAAAPSRAGGHVREREVPGTIRSAPEPPQGRITAGPQEPAAAPAPPAVPAPEGGAPDAAAVDASANARAIQDVVRGFGAVLETRDAARIENAFPGAATWLSSWREFLSTARRLRVRVSGIDQTEVDGGSAQVTFTARLEWDDAGGTGLQQQLRFSASLRQAGGRWVMVRLDAR